MQNVLSLDKLKERCIATNFNKKLPSTVYTVYKYFRISRYDRCTLGGYNKIKKYQ